MQNYGYKLNRAARRMAKKKGIEYTMSEQKQARTKEAIQQDYNQQACILGDTLYRISVLKSDVERMQAKMAELNKEAVELNAAQPAVEPEVVSE